MCMCACVDACLSVCLHACMGACMHACMYVSNCIDMYMLYELYVCIIFACIHITYMYIYMYNTQIHTNTYKYIQVHTSTYKYIQIHTYTHTYIHAYTHIHTHTHIHTYMHTYMPYLHTSYIHTYVRTNIHTRIYLCMHTHMYASFSLQAKHLPEHPSARGQPSQLQWISRTSLHFSRY